MRDYLASYIHTDSVLIHAYWSLSLRRLVHEEGQMSDVIHLQTIEYIHPSSSSNSLLVTCQWHLIWPSPPVTHLCRIYILSSLLLLCLEPSLPFQRNPLLTSCRLAVLSIPLRQHNVLSVFVSSRVSHLTASTTSPSLTTKGTDCYQSEQAC